MSIANLEPRISHSLLWNKSGTSSFIPSVKNAELFLKALSALSLASIPSSANITLYLAKTTVSAATNSTSANFFPIHALDPSLNGINAPRTGLCTLSHSSPATLNPSAPSFFARKLSALRLSHRQGEKVVTSGPQYSAE